MTYNQKYFTPEERKQADKRLQMESYYRNREKRLEANRVRYLENRQAILERSRKYREANRARHRAWSKQNRIDKIKTWLLYAARVRAKKNRLAFDLSENDFNMPAFCPYLRIPIEVASGKRNHGSPTLDRVDNSKGYVRGNVEVISHRANRLKSDMTMGEMALFAKALRKRSYKK